LRILHANLLLKLDDHRAITSVRCGLRTEVRSSADQAIHDAAGLPHLEPRLDGNTSALAAEPRVHHDVAWVQTWIPVDEDASAGAIPSSLLGWRGNFWSTSTGKRAVEVRDPLLFMELQFIQRLNPGKRKYCAYTQYALCHVHKQSTSGDTVGVPSPCSYTLLCWCHATHLALR
jgi:hypothetical protein